jgi:hypothetical protein
LPLTTQIALTDSAKAWLARQDTTIRIAFDNRGHPPELVVRFKLDDAATRASSSTLMHLFGAARP